ncbi:MAG: polysaccharide export protein [Paludibacteraceae bacterium]|nr:polysaccharide export protein [Paludibacteraceae bacterium]
MSRSRIYIILLSVACLWCGCVTQKKMTYLTTVESSTADSLNPQFERQVEPRIKAGDALSITVSALDAEAVVPYNLPTTVYSSPGSGTVNTTPSLQNYMVDAEGNIEFPLLGSLHVEGLLRSEVADLVRDRLQAHVVNPTVIVQLLSPTVVVMGEVNRPGRQTMPNGRLTLLEALGAAGDLTIYGRRDNVLVTREINGKLEFARIDLTSADLFTSPYYYLQQNDVIYVSPNKVRAINSTNLGLWLSMVSTVASAATVIVTVVNTTKK